MENLNLSFFILSFSSLFTLINPIGITPILLSVTENIEDKQYNKIIRKGTLTAYVVLFIFAHFNRLSNHYADDSYGPRQD